jgi:DNA-binding IclR family transcriptional regulator
MTTATIEDASERYRAPALDKGLDILELLSATEEGLSQAEIAKALERTPNEIYRMLDRLVRRGYVARTAGDRYELTLRLFTLAHRHPPMRRLVGQAMPQLRQFARAAEQACHLAVYDRGAVLVVAQVDSPGYWSFAIRVGSHISLLNTGSGHIFLALAGPEERRMMLEEREVMPHESLPPDLDERLDRVRSQGYEMMLSQQTANVYNLSTPILGPQGSVVAVLTCPFLQRLDTDSPPGREAVLKLLVETGRELSRSAGGAP